MTSLITSTGANSSADGPASLRKRSTMLSRRCSSPLDDSQPPRQRLPHLRRQRAEVLLEQLHLDVQRTERIADFVRQPLEQPRQQIALLRHRSLFAIVTERLFQDAFHCPTA